MGGSVVKGLIGAFLVWLSSQMGAFAAEVLEKARLSLQASEMMTISGALTVFATEQRNAARFPRDQVEFERVVRDQLSARGRDPTRDRWNEPYVYEPRGPRAYFLISKGPDKRLGTTDDLIVEAVEDRATINRDPEKIIADSIERKKRLDAEAARRVREILVAAEREKPAKDAKPELDGREKKELEMLARELAKLLG